MCRALELWYLYHLTGPYSSALHIVLHNFFFLSFFFKFFFIVFKNMFGHHVVAKHCKYRHNLFINQGIFRNT